LALLESKGLLVGGRDRAAAGLRDDP
jgi:hypothetical protein